MSSTLACARRPSNGFVVASQTGRSGAQPWRHGALKIHFQSGGRTKIQSEWITDGGGRIGIQANGQYQPRDEAAERGTPGPVLIAARQTPSKTNRVKNAGVMRNWPHFSSNAAVGLAAIVSSSERPDCLSAATFSRIATSMSR